MTDEPPLLSSTDDGCLYLESLRRQSANTLRLVVNTQAETGLSGSAIPNAFASVGAPWLDDRLFWIGIRRPILLERFQGTTLLETF